MVHEIFAPHVKNNLDLLNLPPKAILLMDNASVHMGDLSSSDPDIKIIFLPCNTTALIQPMDQGVIAAFKKNYRRKLMRKFLACLPKQVVQFIHVQSNLI